MNFKRKKSLIISVLGVVVAMSLISIQLVYAASPDAPLSLYEGYEEDSLLFAEIYAKQHGVTVNEAIHRFELQDLVGDLDAEISSKEVETFAGLWIEHTPEFRVVVLFTHNAEETIEPYIQKYRGLAEIIEVRTVEMSLLKLQNV
ncbi:MAG: hypothetical protein Q7T57_04000 [Dehalococcoidales bacterium]|nr:hypothetical protein [Dehalococcoidales bacterium]